MKHIRNKLYICSLLGACMPWHTVFGASTAGKTILRLGRQIAKVAAPQQQAKNLPRTKFAPDPLLNSVQNSSHAKAIARLQPKNYTELTANKSGNTFVINMPNGPLEFSISEPLLRRMGAAGGLPLRGKLVCDNISPVTFARESAATNLSVPQQGPVAPTTAPAQQEVIPFNSFYESPARDSLYWRIDNNNTIVEITQKDLETLRSALKSQPQQTIPLPVPATVHLLQGDTVLSEATELLVECNGLNFTVRGGDAPLIQGEIRELGPSNNQLIVRKNELAVKPKGELLLQKSQAPARPRNNLVSEEIRDKDYIDADYEVITSRKRSVGRGGLLIPSPSKNRSISTRPMLPTWSWPISHQAKMLDTRPGKFTVHSKPTPQITNPSKPPVNQPVNQQQKPTSDTDIKPTPTEDTNDQSSQETPQQETAGAAPIHQSRQQPERSEPVSKPELPRMDSRPPALSSDTGSSSPHDSKARGPLEHQQYQAPDRSPGNIRPPESFSDKNIVHGSDTCTVIMDNERTTGNETPPVHADVPDILLPHTLAGERPLSQKNELNTSLQAPPTISEVTFEKPQQDDLQRALQQEKPSAVRECSWSELALKIGLYIVCCLSLTLGAANPRSVHLFARVLRTLRLISA